MAEDSNAPAIPIEKALHLLRIFRGADLTQTISQIEKSVKGVSAEKFLAVLSTGGAKTEVLGAAGQVKQLAAQIDVVIHTLGILLLGRRHRRMIRRRTQCGDFASINTSLIAASTLCCAIRSSVCCARTIWFRNGCGDPQRAWNSNYLAPWFNGVFGTTLPIFSCSAPCGIVFWLGRSRAGLKLLAVSRPIRPTSSKTVSGPGHESS
jgi:hypothetical protein